MADAINDLADIRTDLLEVVWRWNNVGEADAEDSSCESYESHWGRFHLPGLRHYVSAKNAKPLTLPIRRAVFLVT